MEELIRKKDEEMKVLKQQNSELQERLKTASVLVEELQRKLNADYTTIAPGWFFS